MRLAIFDLDGTVLRGNSWHAYFGWMLHRHPSAAPGLLWALGRRAAGLLDGRGLRDVALRPLCGMLDEEVRAMGEELVVRRLIQTIRPRARHELARRVEEGCVPVLATGAFDFIAMPIADELGMAHVVCTRLGFDGDRRCAGCIRGEETRGRKKAAALEALFVEASVDWKRSCAFSDDLEDAPLFALVGRPVLVTARRIDPTQLPLGVETMNWG